MIPYLFMEVEFIGNTQIIHMEETGITQQTIGLFLVTKYQYFLRNLNPKGFTVKIGLKNWVQMHGKLKKQIDALLVSTSTQSNST